MKKIFIAVFLLLAFVGGVLVFGALVAGKDLPHMTSNILELSARLAPKAGHGVSDTNGSPLRIIGYALGSLACFIGLSIAILGLKARMGIDDSENKE